MKKSTAPNDLHAHVALLRGINVGGHSNVRMEDLRKAFEALGFRDVKTVQASGNVFFRAPEDNTAALATRIEGMLRRTFRRDILTIVRSRDGLRELVDRQPFAGLENKPGVRLFATFFPEHAGTGTVPSIAGEDYYRIVDVSDGIVLSVLYERPGRGAVDLMSAIEDTFGKKVTTRSWNTVKRLAR